MATVLVVDDNPTDRKLLCSLLGHAGHRTVEAADGHQALQLALGTRPELVISDVLMPAMDGYELARRVRTGPGMSGTAVVLWTANTVDPKMEAFAKSCGVSLVLPKPCDPERILTLVGRVLGEEPVPVDDRPDYYDREHLTMLTNALYGKVEELKAAHERLTAFLEAAPDGLVGVDGSGAIRLVNARAESLFGLRREGMLGRSIAAIFADGVPELHRLEAGSVVDLKARRADGSSFPAAVGVNGLEMPEGPLTLLSVRNITDRVEAEERRLSLERQLHLAQRLEAVGQLAGGIAHDFNNLLAVILNYAGFALESLGEHPSRSEIEEIQRAAVRAAALTRQLLVFSRRETGNPEVVDLNEVVAEMESMLRRTIGEHIRLETRLATGLHRVHADPAQVEQVVMNLALNARDAMQAGGTLVIETANERRDAAAYVGLSVSDTGIGMSPDVRDRAFEPFFTTKQSLGGTGLGLASVHGIITASGGEVHISSEPGRGTAVTAYLPATSDDATTWGEQALDAEPPLPGNAETVLVVEDEEGVRAVAQRVLASYGYTVLTAGDASEALGIIMRQPVDLLLTDVVMPGCSGPELAARARECAPDLPVLFMSGYPQDLLGVHGSERDQHRIDKPFTPEAFIRKVREVLDWRKT